jgi:hypothetical protein
MAGYSEATLAGDCCPDQGQVENQVGNVREWVFTPKLRFADLAGLNAHLAARCLELARERAHPDQPERRIIEVWEQERAVLRAIPAPFDGYAEKNCRISATCLVNFERNGYSVECRYVGQVAPVRAYAERIVDLDPYCDVLGYGTKRMRRPRSGGRASCVDD